MSAILYIAKWVKMAIIIIIIMAV